MLTQQRLQDFSIWNVFSAGYIALYVFIWFVSAISFALILRWVLGLPKINRDLTEIRTLLTSIKEEEHRRIPVEDQSEPVQKIPVCCPDCSADLKVPATLLGKTIRCAKCQHQFRITK